MSKVLLVTLFQNRTRLFRLAIESVLDQTLQREKFKYLMFGNGPSKEACDIAKVFAKKFDNFYLFESNLNLGQQKAYNYVLDEWLPKHAPEAKIFSVLDSDDLLVPSALAEVEKMFDAHPEVGMTYSGFHIIDGKGRIKVKNHPKAKLVPNQFSEEGQKMLRRIFLAQNPIGHQRSFRIKYLRDIGGFNTNYQYATDYNAAGRMLEKHWVAKIDKVLYMWRQHDQQVERQHSPQQTKDWQDMQKEFRERWKKLNIV